MVDLVGIGTAASGAGSLVDAFTGGTNRNRRLNQYLGYEALASERQARELQRRAYERGIRDRVEDAKAAGLHPLFALGYQAPQYSVNSAYADYPGGDDTRWSDAARGFEQLGRGLGRMTEGTSKIQDAEVRRIHASASADEAQAAYWNAQTAKIQQAAPVVVPDANAPVEAPPQVKAGEMTSPTGDPGWVHGPSFVERAEALYDELGAILWGGGALLRDLPYNVKGRLTGYGNIRNPDRKSLRRLIEPSWMKKYNTREHLQRHMNPSW